MPFSSTTVLNIGLEILNLDYLILEILHFDIFFFNIDPNQSGFKVL